MPRSSRYKSTKHSSREVREYSDSEKDSSSKDRKGGGEAGGGEERVSSDRVSSGDKRKQLESSKDDNNIKNNNYNDSTGSRNGEEHSSSKRRKERVDDAVSDRWNGRGEDDRGGAEGTKKSKDNSSESSSIKRKRRDENEGLLLVKKRSSSSGKSEGKHKESNKAERERDKDRDRKGKAESFVGGEDPCAVKHLSQKTDFDVDLLRSPESGIQLDRQRKRRRDGSSDRDKYQDDVDIGDKLYSSKEDFSKDGRLRNEKYKEERYKEKYHADRECKYHESKQKDERVSTDYTHNRLDDKHLRDEKETTEIWPKRSKPQDGKYDHERDDDLDCDHDFDLRWDCENYHDKDHENYPDRDRHCIRDHEHDWDYECNHELCRDCEHNRDRDPNLDRDWDWDQDCDRDKDCDQDSDHDKDKEYEQNMDYDGADDEGSSKRKDSWKERKRSLDDYIYGKSKVIQACYPNVEKKSFSSNKMETDIDRGRSQARQPQQDNIVSGNRRRTCPSTCSADEYRHFKPDKLKYRDAVTEQWPKTAPFSEVISFPGASERASKYRSSERSTKLDDVHMGDLSSERSTSKTSPMGLVDRSPLSSSLERRYTIRSTRQSLDIEESVRRSNVSVSARDLTPREDSSTCDMPLEKPLVDDYIPAVSAFYNRTSQGNPALTPGFRGGVDSPFISMLEKDSRTNSGTRYKRSGEPNFGIGQGSTWRGGPMPNGYIPFQHGPPHASFHNMMPQFPSSPLFGVRPSMEVNHSGIPYHIAEADRFSGLLRPLGWQNMMDGSGPTHAHGWDGNSGVYRDEMPMYGGPEWEQSKHPMNGREWESSVDNCKGKNGDAKIDLPLKSLKEDNQKQASIDALFSGKEGQKPENENGYNGVQDRALETKPAVSYSVKEASKLSTVNEIITDPPKLLGDFNNPHSYRAYLSKLDISTELVSPDLFRQFMAFLNVGHRTVVDEKAAMLLNLKDGARAVPKSSNKLSSPLFSATSNTVHERALDIYKNQKLVLHGFQSVNTGPVDGKLAFKEEEQVLVADVNKAEELLLNCQTEMSKVMLDFDPVKSEAALVATGLKSKEMVSSTGQLHIHAYDLCENLDVLDRSLSHDDSLKSTQVVRGDQIDEISSKMVSDSLNLDESCKFHSAEDEDLHGAISDSLLFSDGSSKVSGALMPGSSESELVILTRIHHSPKSTH
ncbi:hypothetical protein K2173_026759 [Erythroxylum novogranatense]|uniref:Uncharacterized protein n=1 Tax=Erythroxylum novogranatense TaxID=1862640 RepID=A0AAV8TX44_9ROSI|nr:hypothetical protein K2173_026759 [Erythroxylum novogranatense]